MNITLPMAAIKILIVEDNPVNCKLLVMVLRSHGYQLLTAVDGEEAVAVASQEKPDLILMDLQLPKMNGYAATQILKEQQSTAHIPIIALTAHVLTDDKELANPSCFDGYVIKPIDTRAFPGEIRKFLVQARANSSAE